MRIFLLFLLATFKMFLHCEQKPATLLLDWAHNPLHIPLYVGQELGFFQSANTPLTLIENVDKANTLNALHNQQADLVISYMPNTIRAASQMDLKVVGILVNKPLRAVIFKRDAHIYSINDLNNKRLGGSPAALTARYLVHLLKKQGIQLKEISPLRGSIQEELEHDVIDAAIGAFWNIEPLQFKQEGFPTRFIRLADCGNLPYDELIIVCQTEWIAKQPEWASRFQEALQKSINFCQSNPDLAFTIYQRLLSPVETWERASWELTFPLFSPNQQVNRLQWSTFQVWMKGEGIVGEEELLGPLIEFLP
ncbi:hypothetical protein PNK_1116 [Candidatus Protochlamydia naegleriophila]|uniref:SsuA/THI5-like domain-containing protein n=1 Tax=Candidatus Protochlamydia naegleriophila TaxID=389348 RepID=A0A0U5JC96_9BACT|nr:ABC transporter substrate-binding protein [Candidatus Protochlamydia naegleriophila]CUI16733.1 hypothetical protein PNK_1116 [Candidatus Protochlamydia naegleriophila]